MKKIVITSVALSLCALTAVFCFTACGNADNSSDSTTTTAAVETTEAAKTALVGTWESVEAPGTSYTFNEDGTGSLNGEGYSTEFKYVDKGSKVEFIYGETTTGEENDYTIKGDTLSLTSEGYGTLTYKKTDDTQKATESSAVAQPDSALLGTWKNTKEDETLTFNADGTGSIKSKATKSSFTFEDKGSSVELKFATTDSQTISYTLKDGKLTITAADGTVSHFTKK
ncbi:MAG: hypothetical protein IJV39_02790 [Ruminococcus sp.]|nr:hypothetical protein [Ruminococcus sp.]